MGTNKMTSQSKTLPAVRIAELQLSATRLRAVLSSLELFGEAAIERDPLPSLADLSRSLLHADAVSLTVPALPVQNVTPDAWLITRPIRISGRMIGRLDAQRATPFNADDQAIAVFLSHIISVVLEQSTLCNQNEQYRHQIEAQSGTLDQLLAFNQQIIGGTADYQQLALLLATQVPAMVGGERASLLLTPADQPDTPQLALSNGTFSSTERARTVRDSGLAGLVLREQRPIILDETETDRRWLSLDDREYEGRSRCAMAVPLLWHNQALGALTVTTTQSHRFGSSHLDLMELVACHVSLALHSTNLAARLQGLTDLLGDLVHNLNDPLQAAQLGIHMLLPLNPDVVEVQVDTDDLTKIAAAMERIALVGRQLAAAHRSLLALTNPAARE